MKPLRILVADDEEHASLTKLVLELAAEAPSINIEVEQMAHVPNLFKGNNPITSWDFDVIILDLKMGYSIQGSDADIYKVNGVKYGGCYAAHLLAASHFKGAVLVNSGFINKPLAITEPLRNELDALRNRCRYFEFHRDEDDLKPMLRLVLETSADWKYFSTDLYQEILFAATTDEPILLLGETGTGKEIVAESIHQHWLLRKHAEQNAPAAAAPAPQGRPFTAVNCALFSYELMRDELMGHAKLWRSAELTHPCSTKLTQWFKAGVGAFYFQVVEGVAV
jgi:DNA-binding NtrC family response regulator